MKITKYKNFFAISPPNGYKFLGSQELSGKIIGKMVAIKKQKKGK